MAEVLCKTEPIILDSCFHRNDGEGAESEQGIFLCYRHSFLATNEVKRSAIMD